MSSLIRMLLLCVAFILEGTTAVLITVPENEMVFLNRKTELQCSTNSTELISWSFTAAGSTADSVVLFIHNNFTIHGEGKYSINRSNSGHNSLVIESVDLSYAGKYKCSEGSFGPHAEAELVVIDPQPLCQVNASNILVENDYLWLQCDVRVSNTNLSMTWIRNRTGSVIENISNQTNQSMIVIQVDYKDNGQTFTFNATFRQENNRSQTVITWNYTAKVLYTPRSLVLSPGKIVYVVGDRLECSADGNPTPCYEWTDIDTNRTINGSVLTIDEYMTLDQNYTFRCTAYNTVAGLTKHISQTITFSVTGSTSKPEDSLLIVTVAVIIVAVTVFCFILLTGYICFRVFNKIKSKRHGTLAERQLHQSEFGHEMGEETTIENEETQDHVTTPQFLGNEGNYADLMDRSINDQQYSQLHIYANASASASAKASTKTSSNTSVCISASEGANAEYANRGFIELMQLAKDHYNIADN